MKFLAAVLVVFGVLSAIGCNGNQDASTAKFEATVAAAVEATREAESALDATVKAQVAATLTRQAPHTDTEFQPTPILTQTPRPTANPTPSATPVPTSTRRTNLTATPLLTHTPRPTPTLQPTLFPTAKSLPLKEMNCKDLASRFLDNFSDTVAEVIMVEDLTHLESEAQCRGLSHFLDGNVGAMTIYLTQIGQLVYETDTLKEHDCDYLLPEMMQFNSEEHNITYDAVVFSVSEIEEFSRSWDELICGGYAVTSKFDAHFEFNVNIDIEGYLHYSWRFLEE